MGILTGRSDPPHPQVKDSVFYVAQHTNRRDEKCDCVTRYFDLSVTGWPNNNKSLLDDHSITEAKNFKCYRRLINKQLPQVSGLCGTLFLSYLSKRSTQICRSHIGVLPRDTNMSAGNQWKHLELTFAMRAITFPSWVCIHTHKHLS